MASTDVLERIGAMREASRGRARISVTDLARGNEWRTELPEVGVMEVTDRGETAAWLLSDEDMRSLMEGYSLLEEELEQAQIAAIFAAREEYRDLRSGDDLRDTALAVLDARSDEFMELANGD